MSNATPPSDASADPAGVPDLSPPPPADAPAPDANAPATDNGAGAAASGGGFDYAAFARAAAEENAKVMQQFAPKPAAKPQPWDSPDYYDLKGVPPERLHTEFAKRTAAHQEWIADQRAEAKIAALKDEIRAAFQGQAAHFKSQFAIDPGFKRVESHFGKYIAKGYSPEDARYLAERDAGGHGAATPGAAAGGPRPAPAPPKHATSPAVRSGAPQAGAQGKWNIYDKSQREARFGALAAQHGFDND